MTHAGAPGARVTLVLVPRERFSYTRTSLESIYEHTDGPFRLVCVDGGSPSHVRRYLEAQARTRGFDLVRTDHYLSPNRARNLGLRRARTPWIVFIDNDVVVTPGWLPSLVACGDESGADIVSPLLCEGTPVHSIIHCAGGETGVRVEAHADGSPTRHIIEKIARQGQRVSDVRSGLKRAPTGLAEFHCMLVRASVLERLGALDERMLNTKEHVDLCMTVSAAGGTIYFEPTSVVTFVPGPPLAWSDMPFYMLRWSDAWELASLKHLQKKWHLAEDTYFIRRYQSVGGRRRVAIVRPLVRALRLGRLTPQAEGRLVRVDRVLNGYLTRRYARRHLGATG